MRVQKWTTALIAGAASIVIGAAVMAAPTIPVLWMAGGLDSGTTGAGQAARMTADASGNVAVVSGPALSRDLAVTSYTSDGTFRWRRAITPAVGTFTGDWIAASTKEHEYGSRRWRNSQLSFSKASELVGDGAHNPQR